MPEHPLSLFNFIERFKDDEACRNFLAQMFWKRGKPVCPHCKCKEIYYYTNRPVYKCAGCLKQFRVTTGTIFENSKVPLKKWFLAIKLLACTKKGISSIQLSKELGITQKSAWYMEQKIRLMLANTGKKKGEILGGIVEVDETYIGGRKRGGKRGRGTDKAKVFGMLERDGTLHIMPVERVNKQTLQSIIFDYVEVGSVIMSDEWKAYNGLNQFYVHRVINHGCRHYADGEIHVNSLEGAWGLFKRSLKGIYHRPSKKYMDNYCGEFMFRYNTRKMCMTVQFKEAISQSKIRVTNKDVVTKK